MSKRMLPQTPLNTVKEMRIVGLYANDKLNPESTVTQLRSLGEKVGRMIPSFKQIRKPKLEGFP